MEDFNSRNLSDLNFVALMVDGVNFGDRTVVVVLGIDMKGKKHILGLREGSTENWELWSMSINSVKFEKGYSFFTQPRFIFQ